MCVCVCVCVCVCIIVVEIDFSSIRVVITFILFGIFYKGIFEAKFYVCTPSFLLFYPIKN